MSHKILEFAVVLKYINYIIVDLNCTTRGDYDS